MVRDRRGQPASQLTVRRAGSIFGHLLYSVRRNGVCLLTEAKEPRFALIKLEDGAPLTDLICAVIAVAAARRRNPNNVFTVADQVFGSSAQADWWMAHEVWSLGGKRPVDMLTTYQGATQVLNILGRIQHGIFA